MTRYIISIPEDYVSDFDAVISQDSIERPGRLRWLDGRLQQEWTRRQYYESGASDVVSRWEFVPTVEGDAK